MCLRINWQDPSHTCSKAQASSDLLLWRCSGFVAVRYICLPATTHVCDTHAGADSTVALQYGYDYDVTNGVTPYSMSQTSQHTHTPTIKVPTGTVSRLSTSVGLQPALRAGLKGSVLWNFASGMQTEGAQVKQAMTIISVSVDGSNHSCLSHLVHC